MATKTTKHDMTRVYDELVDVGRQASERLGELFTDQRVRTHLEEAGKAFEDLWSDIVEHLRQAAEAKPFDEMTVEELRHAATERKIPGRSKMHRDELIAALRRH